VAPQLVALTGFEFGTTAGIATGNAGNTIFDGVTGTLGTDLQVISGAAHTGGYGLRVALTGKCLFWNTNTLGAAKTALVVSLWFRLSTNPTTDTDIISMDTAASTDRAGFFYQASTGKLAAWIAGATNQLSAATVNDGAWHLLQWKFDVSGTQTTSWSLDGVGGTAVSGGTASTTARLSIGNRSAGTGVCDYDDIVVSSTVGDYPLGRHHVEVLTVDPAGTVTATTGADFDTFTANGTLAGGFVAATARAAVAERPPTVGVTADGLVQIVTSATDYVELPMTTYGLGSGELVSGIRMLAAGWENSASSTVPTIGFRSFNGVLETVLFAAANPAFTNSTTTPAWVAKMLTTVDVDTQAELDALTFRVGFSTGASPAIGIHAIYAELAVLVKAAPPNVWVAPSQAVHRAAGW
jgi:hypothetical protein